MSDFVGVEQHIVESFSPHQSRFAKQNSPASPVMGKPLDEEANFA